MRINKSVPVETVDSTEVVDVQFHAVLEIPSAQELVGFHQIHMTQAHVSFELLVPSRKKDNSIEQISDGNPCTGT
jgi:hypothetical protein